MTQPYSAEELPTILETLGYLVQERHPSHLCTISAECVERLAATLAELAGLREQVRNPKGTHDGPCRFCGEDTNSYAANPGKWPLYFCMPGDNGRGRVHHVRCVVDRLASRSLPGALKEEKE